MRYPATAALLLVLLVLPVVADEPAAPTGSDVSTLEGSIRHQERDRTYRLLLPRGHDRTKAVPLVLALHGGGGTAKGLDASTHRQFAREAARRGWIVVFPQGVAKGWNDGRRLTSLRDRQRRGVDDVGFLSALIDHLRATYGIDATRVYATGISNGGFMSYRLGLELSAKVAAIAPVTANLQKTHDGKKPAHPVGLLVINGTADPLVPYQGGQVRVLGRPRGTIHSTDETMKRWAAFNACSGEPSTVLMPDRDPGDGTRPYDTVWTACEKHAQVRLIRVQGGGHTWPGGQQYLPPRVVGRVCRDFEAVPLIFDFFAKHRRAPATASPR